MNIDEINEKIEEGAKQIAEKWAYNETSKQMLALSIMQLAIKVVGQMAALSAIAESKRENPELWRER